LFVLEAASKKVPYRFHGSYSPSARTPARQRQRSRARSISLRMRAVSATLRRIAFQLPYQNVAIAEEWRRFLCDEGV
jgi:hypothetical protein